MKNLYENVTKWQSSNYFTQVKLTRLPLLLSKLLRPRTGFHSQTFLSRIYQTHPMQLFQAVSLEMNRPVKSTIRQSLFPFCYRKTQTIPTRKSKSLLSTSCLFFSFLFFLSSKINSLSYHFFGIANTFSFLVFIHDIYSSTFAALMIHHSLLLINLSMYTANMETLP